MDMISRIQSNGSNLKGSHIHSKASQRSYLRVKKQSPRKSGFLNWETASKPDDGHVSSPRKAGLTRRSCARCPHIWTAQKR
eukprot:4744630-Pyramimonas_sp.AAC.1